MSTQAVTNVSSDVIQLIIKYRKNSKNWDTIMTTVIVVNVERYGLTLPECIQKSGDGIANSVDPDQTAP